MTDYKLNWFYGGSVSFCQQSFDLQTSHLQ
jgi:hypothetical protein